MNNNPHFVYIDKLKGLAILSVIMGHSILWVMGQGSIGNPVYEFIYSWHMPLFWFLSGIIITPPNQKKIQTRLLRYMMPVLTVGGIYLLVINQTIIGSLYDKWKIGYWYLWVLSCFNIILMLFRSNGRWKGWLWDLVLGVFIYALLSVLMSIVSKDISNLLSLQLMCLYWPWFFIGYLFGKNNIVNILTGDFNNIVFSLSLLIFFYILLIGGKIYVPGILLLSKWVMPLSVIIMLLSLFRMFDNDNSWWQNELSRFGKRSLDIYIYHYFFVFPIGSLRLHEIGVWFTNTNNYLLEFVVLIIIAAAIAYLCVFVGYLVRRSKLFERLVYGIYD